MHKIRIEDGKKVIRRRTPENWNECTLRQLQFISQVIFSADPNRVKQSREEILVFFLDLKWKVLRNMNQAQLDGLQPAIDFLFKDIALTKNPLPVIQTGRHWLHGPTDELKSITAGEFAFADRFLFAYMKTKEQRFLDLLVATLYRKKNGLFDEEKIEELLPVIARLDNRYKLPILCFYLGSRRHITQSHPAVFPKGGKSKPPKAGWLGLFYDMAGPKTGTYGEVAGMKFSVLLSLLEKMQEDADKEKRRLSKMKR